MKRKKIFLALFIFASIMTILFNFSGINKVLNLPDEFYTNIDEVSQANKEETFGKFIKLSMDKGLSTSSEGESEKNVTVKLFGIIPIKKIKAKILPEEEVYIGGVPVGMSLTSQGAVVVSDYVVDCQNLQVQKNNFFKVGDIITSIDNKTISSLEDIDKVLSNVQQENVNVEYIRNNQAKSGNIGLIKDSEGRYKLGIWARDDFSGVGTLTFVKKNNTYAALGHAITNGQDDNVIPMQEGSLYSCSLVGVNKGQKNKPGELKCVFVKNNERGDIQKNTQFGIYGFLDNSDGLIDQNVTAILAGRLSVKPGKAKIISAVSGIREEYEIEIIKANYQDKHADKSLVFRVTDPRLIELTGGIVQGMSGSPILQNGKLVGAVTHVFLSDPTKGYGVYSDWMLEQMEN